MAGMLWKKRWNIKQFLTDEDVGDGCAHEIGALIADYLERKDPDLERDAPFMVDAFRDADSQNAINYALVDLYDWADANRVWLGS